MGQPAARLGDTAGHGGTIVFGATTVLIGSMPAARMGDPLACPAADGPKPHVMGNITMASTTVIIAGAFAARMGDTTGCGAAGVSGVGAPPVAGPPEIPGNFNREGALVGNENVGFGYGQYTGYANEDGEQHGGKISAEHLGGTYRAADGSTATGNIDGLTGTAEAHYGSGGGGASAAVSVIKADGRITDADGNSAGASGGLLNAAAGGEAVLGTDGRRTGLVLGLSAQASLAEGQLDRTMAIGIPYTDYSFNIGATAGGSLGAVGGAANVGAFHDAADDRVHLAGMIDIEAVIGAKLGLDLSFGRRANAGGGAGTPGIPVPLVPGTVLTGCTTVLIG